MKIIFNTFFIIFLFFSSTFSKANDLIIAYQALEKEDYKTAIYFFSYYANLGNSKAQYNYAIMLKKGLGTIKNENEAFNWFFLSAKQNHMLANYALAQAYQNGNGTKINYRLSMQTYQKAALLGHATSKLHLGNLYFQGLGTKKNYPKAHFWWKLALDQNVNGAEKNIQMIEKIMTNKEKVFAKNIYFRCIKTTLFKCLNN